MSTQKKSNKIQKNPQITGLLNYKIDYLSLGYLLLLGVVCYNIYQYTYDTKIFLGGDNAAYYITGCALAEGHGYSNIHMVNNPPANHFPPGYPYIISLIIRMFGDDLQTIKTSNGFFLLGVIVLLFFIIKRLTQNSTIAFIASLLSLLNAHLLFYSYIKMSEIPFTFFSLLSIWMFIKAFTHGNGFKQVYFWLFIISILITFYIRSLGITIIGASVIILLLNKRWAQACMVAGCVTIAYIPWQIRSENLGGNAYAEKIQMINPYRADLGKMKITDYPKRFIENIKRYTSKEIFSAVLGYTINDYKKISDWKQYLYCAILLLFILLGVFSLKEFKWFVLMYIGGTFFILMLWPPVWIGIRFMLPLIPILVFLFMEGVLFIISKPLKSLKSKKWFGHFAPFLFLLIIPQSKAHIQELKLNSRAPYNPNFASYFSVAAWCKNNLPDSAVIATRKPELFFLFARHKVTSYSLNGDIDQFINDLEKRGVTHIVLDKLGYSSTGLYLVPAIMNNPEKFKVIKQDKKDTYLYQIFYQFGYSGEFKNGKRNGQGKVKYPDGSSYEGAWNENKKEGYGKYRWPTGEWYIGHFINDKRGGKGTLFYRDSSYVESEWNNDKPGGRTVRYTKEGKIITKNY